MKITKHKDAPGAYSIRADGRETGLRIYKDDERTRPWGAPQEWDVVQRDSDPERGDFERFLFTQRGLEDAFDTVRRIAEAFTS